MDGNFDSRHLPETHQPPQSPRTSNYLIDAQGQIIPLRDLGGQSERIPTVERPDPTHTYTFPDFFMEEARQRAMARHLRESVSSGPPTDLLRNRPPVALPSAPPQPVLGATSPLPPDPITRLRLPASARGTAGPGFWTIELHGLMPKGQVLALDVLGDVVIGRTDEADLNLDLYHDPETTISRRHALLRPTTWHLYLLDLNSSNGTSCNGALLGRASVVSLQYSDVISLGLLIFTIKIIARPASSATAQTGFRSLGHGGHRPRQPENEMG